MKKHKHLAESLLSLHNDSQDDNYNFLVITWLPGDLKGIFDRLRHIGKWSKGKSLLSKELGPKAVVDMI